MLTTLPLPCQKCYKQVKKGGGDCVDCNKVFCQNDSIKVEVGKMENKTLYGVRCNECEAKMKYKDCKLKEIKGCEGIKEELREKEKPIILLDEYEREPKPCGGRPVH